MFGHAVDRNAHSGGSCCRRVHGISLLVAHFEPAQFRIGEINPIRRDNRFGDWIMKAVKVGLFGIAAAMASTGCMAVSATDNSRGVRHSQQVVAVGDNVYLIDIKTGNARKIDLENAQPFTVEPEEKSIEIEASSVD